MGQEQLGAPAAGFGHHGRGSLQGHQDGLHRLRRVTHFEAGPVPGHGPRRWIAAFQQIEDVLQRRAHRT